MKVCILGGDKRQLEIIKKMKGDYEITLVGYEHLNDFNDLEKINISDIDLSKFDSIILPVNGINNDYTINTLFGEDFSVESDLFVHTKKNVLIFTGIITNVLDSMLKASDREAQILMQDKDVIRENTIPTVEGILADVINNTNITINNSKILVIGYGNIGKRLVHILNKLGAKVTVGVIEAIDIMTLTKLYQEAVLTTSRDNMENTLKDIDIIINTAPTLVLDNNYLESTNRDAYILDVSSYPYGVDFEYANTLGIKNKLLPGIPAKVAPITAGLILTRKIEHKLRGEQ